MRFKIGSKSFSEDYTKNNVIIVFLNLKKAVRIFRHANLLYIPDLYVIGGIFLWWRLWVCKFVNLKFFFEIFFVPKRSL